jgi:hypothetical protein
MIRRKAFALVLTVALDGGLAYGADAIRDWPAPAVWSPVILPEGLAASAASALPFTTVTPCRGADTRGFGFTGQYGPPSLAGTSTRTFTIAGTCGIPASAAAVSFNFTVTNNPTYGDIRVFPEGESVLVSTLNWGPTTGTVANAAVVALSPGGAITVQVDGPGPLDLVYDINGYYAGAAGGSRNTFVGRGAGNDFMTGDSNTGVGFSAFAANTTGNNNTAVGQGALQNVVTGSNNIGIGLIAGAAFLRGESDNICIGNSGVPGDSGTIRIGTTQTQTFLQGIYGVSVDGLPVLIDSHGQLGTGTGLMSPGPLRAQELQVLRQTIQEQRERILELERRISTLEKLLRVN